MTSLCVCVCVCVKTCRNMKMEYSIAYFSYQFVIQYSMSRLHKWQGHCFVNFAFCLCKINSQRKKQLALGGKLEESHKWGSKIRANIDDALEKRDSRGTLHFKAPKIDAVPALSQRSQLLNARPRRGLSVLKRF